MQEITSEKDLLIVPTSYFEGLERMLQEFVNDIEIHNLNTMEKLLHLRKQLKPKIVNEEVRKYHPTIQWDNIHLVLPPKANC